MALHNINIAKSDIYWEVQANYVNMRQLERKIPLMNSKVKATLENFELADGRYSALDGCDALILITEWKEFRTCVTKWEIDKYLERY